MDRLRIISFISGLVFCFNMYAQDLSNMGFKKGVKVNGGVNLSNIFYHTNDTIMRRDPYQFILTGNLNLNLFGYDAPFTFTYSNSQRSYTQPFNRLSFNPQYKWVKTYIGYTSMSFSPYTLSGHSFLGAGAELSPGNWRIALMGGQLKKAIDYDPLNAAQVVPSYKRMGYGLKIGYEQGANGISANIFSAKDIINSVHQLPPDGSLHPMQNVAIGISGRTVLLKYITLQGEYSVSLLNGDTRMKTVTTDSTQVSSLDNPLSSQTPATRTFNAYSGGIGYQASTYGVMLRYERVSPEYQTLGAYYFNNDMENITIVPNVRLFKGKISIAGNAGLQKNNLDKSRESTTKRWVGAGNISFNPNEKWNMAANFSNFSTYTRMKPQNDPFFKDDMDSLNFYQVTNSMGGTVNYTFGKKEAPHSLMLNATYQEASETNPTAGNNLSEFLSASGSYSHLFPNAGISASLSYNMNTSSAPQMKSFYHGPAINISKTLFEKTLRAGLTSAWNKNTLNHQDGSPVFSNGLNLGYTPKSEGTAKHSFTCSFHWLQRFPSELKKDYRSEITANLNYAFTF